MVGVLKMNSKSVYSFSEQFFLMTPFYDFTQLDALKRKVDALRPLEAELYAKLQHKLNIDWTYNSNAIEGNTLTLSETRFFLESGLTSKGKPLSEYLEIKNHKYALDYLEQVVREKQPLSERLIKELHAMLFERNETYEVENELGQKIKKNVLPGKYKQENNYVLLPDGSKKHYMDPLKTVDAMQDLIVFYNENKEALHPIVLASELHTRFVSIHPFVDGNGRVARLILNLVLMQAGYGPAIIQNEFKQGYYEALRHYDQTGEISSFISIVEQEALRTLQIILNAAEGKKILDLSDTKKRIDHFTKAMEALDKDVGKLTKKVNDQDKKKSIVDILNYLQRVASEKINGLGSELFEFEVKYPIRLEDFTNETFINTFSQKNIIPTLPTTYEPGIKRHYKDFIQEKVSGSGMVIGLKTTRSFIPSAQCYLAVIPTKYTLCVTSMIDVPELEGDKEFFQRNSVISMIQNGVLWEDWNKKDLNHFFAEVFDQFLAMIQDEAEKRRIQMEEKKV